MKDARIETINLVLGETKRTLMRELKWRHGVIKELIKSDERIKSAIKDLEYLESVATRIENDEE
jgi:hypothetical protein